jgi:hypothetical protein
LLEDPKPLAATKLDFAKRMENRKYVTLIPTGQKAPKAIRQACGEVRFAEEIGDGGVFA